AVRLVADPALPAQRPDPHAGVRILQDAGDLFTPNRLYLMSVLSRANWRPEDSRPARTTFRGAGHDREREDGGVPRLKQGSEKPARPTQRDRLSK
ncbi:MAG: hypothetical protein ABFD65_00540, partial [Candidatus Polarisedimenticolia bacterium]